MLVVTGPPRNGWRLIKTIARQDPRIICLLMARGELSRRYDHAVSDRN